MTGLVFQIFSYALLVAMAMWCGEALYQTGAGKTTRWGVFAMSGASMILFSAPTALLLMYLLTQGIEDAREGYVDVLLSLQAGATMGGLVVYGMAAAKSFSLAWLLVAWAGLFVLAVAGSLSNGDVKGLAVIALWGEFYTDKWLSVPAVMGILIALVGVLLFGLLTKKREDVPMFPWLWLGMSVTAGLEKTGVFDAIEKVIVG